SLRGPRLEGDVFALNITKFTELLAECCAPGPEIRTASEHDFANSNCLSLLLCRRQRAKGKEHGANHQAHDFRVLTIACRLRPIAADHLITLSALASTFGGIFRF